MSWPRRRRARRTPLTARQKMTVVTWIALLSFTAFLIPAVRFFRTLTGSMAVSNASDHVARTVSDIVGDMMRRLESEGADGFVTLEKDASGAVTAIVTDTAGINLLSTRLLSAVVEASDAGDLDVSVPLGDLLGSSFFLGRGPRVPVKISMLTSSRVYFRNVLSDAGINQTKHQLLLIVQVDADVLLPWTIRSAQIITEVLAAETIIVGRVPETYVSIG